MAYYLVLARDSPADLWAKKRVVAKGVKEAVEEADYAGYWEVEVYPLQHHKEEPLYYTRSEIDL